MAFDVSDSRAVQQKVLANHLHVAKPVTPVYIDAIVDSLHNKGRRCFINTILACNGRGHVLHILLPGHVTHDHLLDDLT